MSKIKDLSYDIEQLYIEGVNPSMIALLLDCPIDLIYQWIEKESLQSEELSPFETINS